MTENSKNTFSRRKLLGDMGKLAYVAPTLTLFSVVTNNAQAQSASMPPCPPSDPECAQGIQSANPKQKSRTQSRRKKPEG